MSHTPPKHNHIRSDGVQQLLLSFHFLATVSEYDKSFILSYSNARVRSINHHSVTSVIVDDVWYKTILTGKRRPPLVIPASSDSQKQLIVHNVISYSITFSSSRACGKSCIRRRCTQCFTNLFYMSANGIIRIMFPRETSVTAYHAGHALPSLLKTFFCSDFNACSIRINESGCGGVVFKYICRFICIYNWYFNCCRLIFIFPLKSILDKGIP